MVWICFVEPFHYRCEFGMRLAIYRRERGFAEHLASFPITHEQPIVRVRRIQFFFNSPARQDLERRPTYIPTTHSSDNATTVQDLDDAIPCVS